MEKQPPVCEVTMMDSEDELFIMYTSGTSSAAKGIVHTHAGYLLYVAATHKVELLLVIRYSSFYIQGLLITTFFLLLCHVKKAFDRMSQR